ncbi:MAG: lysophospholipid acyltransferase family protein [Gemmatimonadales bacterium]
MIRALWYIAVLVVGTLWWGSRVVGASLLRIPNRPGGVYDQAPGGWSQLQLSAAGVKVTVEGAERIPKDQPVVFVSNHQSWFDILSLAANLPGYPRFVYKKEMARIPVLGEALKRAGHILIDRQNRQRAFEAYDEAARVIREGMSAVVFPEGTRSRTGEMLPFKKGPFVLAIASQVPLVPVYCAGTFGIMPKGTLWVRPLPVTLRLGEPIETKGLTYDDREDLLQRTRAAIEALREAGDRTNRTN